MDPRKYATLLAVVQESAAGRDGNARALLDRAIGDHLEAGARAEDLHFYLFARALTRRLASGMGEEINLYLRQFQETQISLFNLVARHLPTVGLTAPLANELLARFVGGHDEVTLLDIGIGSGHQETAMLRRLAQQGRLPKRLNVVAVEPDAGSLIEAQMGLFEASVELGIELEFVPMHKVVEDMTEADWGEVAAFDCPLVVVAAFAAHHIQCTESDTLRDRIFARIRELDPDAVVLAEPSSNHHAADFVERFKAAWHHFGLTFELIDELDVAPEEAAGMKMFFAREIEDIVGNAEATRFERHEPVESWVARLRRAGFTPYADFEFARETRHDLVRVAAHEGYIGLDYADETLVAVVCATSGVPAANRVRRARRFGALQAVGG